MVVREQRSIWLHVALLVGGLLLLPAVAYLMLRSDRPKSVVRQVQGEEVVAAPRDHSPQGNEGRYLGGSVVDEAGTPLTGVRVVVNAADGHAVASMRTDDSGAFSVDDAPDEVLSLTAEAKGLLAVTKRVTALGDQTDIKIIMKAGEPIRGRVVDAEGAAVAGATVRCVDRDVSAQSGEDGTFALGTSEGCVATASHQLFGGSEQVQLVVDRDNLIQMPNWGAIRGVVEDETGARIASGSVMVDVFRPADKGVDALAGDSVELNDKGEFELKNLARGTYVLKAVAPNRPSAKSKAIEVAAGHTVRGLRLVIETGVSVTGTVTDKQGRTPLSGVRVALDGEVSGVHTMSDAQGHFELSGVPRGPASLSFRHPDYIGRIVTIDTKTKSTNLQIDLSVSAGSGKQTELSGIGATLGMGSTGVIIAGVLTGSPAESAGVHNGDVIVAIDGVDASTFGVNDCIHRIRGPEGTRVSLRIDRNGVRHDFTVRRAIIQR